MSGKVGAYGAAPAAGAARRTWDKEEYTQKAREKDREEKERMQENEERMHKGKKPRRQQRTEDLPKPTEMMKQRDGPLELEKNLNKTMIVQNPGGRGSAQPGFYCDICKRNHKDSAGYLDHINSRSHLRRLGQTTRIARSTLDQVRARIAYLREKTREKSDAKAFDFDKRLESIRQAEVEARKVKKEAKKAERDQRLLEAVKNTSAEGGVEDEGMAGMMGFAGFGTTKK